MSKFENKKSLVFAVDKSSFNDRNHLGVRKKVYSQLDFFTSIGLECKLFEYEWDNGYPSIEVEFDTDFLYFRTIEPSIKLIKKLYSIKKQANNIRIIMEIPTYPFSGEKGTQLGSKRKISVAIGKSFLKHVIDRVVVIGMNNSIEEYEGISVIHATNGIDCKQIRKVNHSINDDINIIAVSGCYFWHGYDRMIKGMKDYYSNNGYGINVKLHIVGEGDCLKEYIELAESFGLKDKYIFFYGIKEGEELDKLYDMADLAINVLAVHRKGMQYDNSLKSRESIAKGIPYISSSLPDICDEELMESLLIVPADESNIRIDEIVSFYKRIYRSHKKNANVEIQKLAERLFSWDSTFAGVAEYLIRE